MKNDQARDQRRRNLTFYDWSWTHFIRAMWTRSSWTIMKQVHDGLFTHDIRAIGPYGRRQSSWSSYTMMMQHAHDLCEWLELTLNSPCTRAMCTATKLIDLNELLIIHCEAICITCARRRISWTTKKWNSLCTEPCARRRSSWTTMKQAHDWLWSHLFTAMCTATKLMELINNTTKKLIIDCELILIEPRAHKAHEKR